MQLVVIAVVTSVIGTAIGYVAQSGIAWLLRDLLRGDLPPPSADAFVLGIVTAVVVLVGFALPPLLRLKRVPPARVLRRDLEPPPLRYAVVYGLAIGAVLALLYWIVRDPKLVGYVAGGLGATFLLLARRRLAAGAGAGAVAQRRRRGLALWSGQHRAPRPRQHRADRGVRARLHGAAAAGAGARRPAARLAAQPACRRAQLLHDQHPPGRRAGRASSSSAGGAAVDRAGADAARAADGDQRDAGREASVPGRSRQRVRRARGQPDLGGRAGAGQQDRRGQWWQRDEQGGAAGLRRDRLRRAARAEARRHAQVRHRRRGDHRPDHQPARGSLGHVQAEFLRRVLAGRARRRRPAR